MFLLFAICFLQGAICYAQKRDSGFIVAIDTTQYGNKPVRFVDRFSFRTNYINWLIGIPNVGLEFDLSSMDYGKWTINIEGQYRPASHQEIKSHWVYDKTAYSFEVRRYYRTSYDMNDDKWWSGKDSTILNFWRHLVRLKRANSRDWRSYYIGPYAETGQYDFKFSEKGYKGSYIGGGASFGYNIRLYQFSRQAALDLELGTRVGFFSSKSQRFVLDEESNCYRHVPSKYEDWHMHYYPVITDLHVSLVFRSCGISKKYLVQNEKWQEHLVEMRKFKKSRRETAKKAEENLDSIYSQDKIIREKVTTESGRKKSKETIDKDETPQDNPTPQEAEPQPSTEDAALPGDDTDEQLSAGDSAM